MDVPAQGTETQREVRAARSWSGRRLHEVDLLRFIAAMSVVLFHYTFRGAAAGGLSAVSFPLLAPVSKYGYLGVDLFFLISGFVIMMTASRASLGTFVASRVSRLYPAFWASCTITALAIIAFADRRFSVTVAQYVTNMTMLGGLVGAKPVDGVYWSLFIELKFYVMVGVILALGWVKRAEQLLLVWLGASIALEIVPVHVLRSALLVEYSAFFIGGAICYFILAEGVTRGRLLALALACALAVYESITALAALDAAYATHFSSLAVAGAVVTCFAVMLLVSLGKASGWARPEWALLGALTYPLYLLHQDIGYMTMNAAAGVASPAVLLVVTIALALGLAYLVNVVVERPMGPLLKTAGLNVAEWARQLTGKR